MNILEDPSRVLGTFTTQTPGGDTYKTTVFDLECWSTGSVMVRQEGEGKIHDQVFDRAECGKLAVILGEFALNG